MKPFFISNVNEEKFIMKQKKREDRLLSTYKQASNPTYMLFYSNTSERKKQVNGKNK